MHAALHDRVLDAEHFGNVVFVWRSPRVSRSVRAAHSGRSLDQRRARLKIVGQNKITKAARGSGRVVGLAQRQRLALVAAAEAQDDDPGPRSRR